MGLLDGYVPQGFADRGGMLGRLLSLRPDLAQDEQQDQPGQDQPAQARAQPPNNISTSAPATSVTNAPGHAIAASASGNADPVQLARASPIRIYSPDPLYVQPQFDPPPAYPPFIANNPPLAGDVSGAGALLGLGLGALILKAKKAEEPSNEEETIGQPAVRPPTGSLPIDQTPWSGDHTEIKGEISSDPPDHVRISPRGYVWGHSWTNHGPADSFTASGKPSGQRGKDRGRWK